MTFPAMIFAAGFGTRMGVLTKDIPKPMVPLAGRPMIDHTIDLLRAAGIDHIVANTHYHQQVIEPHLVAKGVNISAETPTILDTGGGLKAALGTLDGDPVLTINPDAAWLGANPINQLIDAWQPDMQALLMLVPLAEEHGRETGDFSLEHGTIRRKGDYIYSGAQLIRTKELGRIKETAFSLNRYWDLLAEQAPLHAVVYDGTWCDIGNPDGLAKAEGLLAHV